MLLLKLMSVNAFKMLLSFIIIFIMMIFYRVRLSPSFFYALPALLILFIFTYGVACFLMHYGVYVEDLGYIITILMSMLMYFTGIFYSIENRMPEPFGHILSLYNPVACLITVMRNALLYGKNASPAVLGIWFLVSALIAAAGTQLIYKNENSYVKVI